MSKSIWTWAFMGAAVVLVGSYIAFRLMTEEPSIQIPTLQQVSSTRSAVIETGKKANPLLSADRLAVDRWVPGFCFAELYMDNPSFDGKLIRSCTKSVIEEVKTETGITLTEADIHAPEVFAHFKQFYGVDGQWRQ